MGSCCAKFCTWQRLSQLAAECEALNAACEQKAAQVEQLMKELNDVKSQLAKILELPPQSNVMK